MSPENLLSLILPGYALPLDGAHGLDHWGRVWENGLKLAEAAGANPLIPSYFAVFHDARRVTEARDPEHGLRGARLAVELREHVELTDSEFDQLYYACEHHTSGLTEADPEVQVCWDADRADLGRVGIQPDRRRLCTPLAKSQAFLTWAHQRAVDWTIPDVTRATRDALHGGWTPRVCRV